MLIDRHDSALLVVDMQERLVPAIKDWQRIVERAVWLLRVARRLEVPILACEQYPSGLGHTHPEVAAELPAGCIVEKRYFSALVEGPDRFLRAGTPSQFVVCGAESHVCVLQTVADLCAKGKSVFVVDDAIGSRTDDSKRLALARMSSFGATVVNSEMVAFEWLRCAGDDTFREISRNFLR